MAHGSKPQLMNRVVDAVVYLCERKGSTARDVLDYLRRTSTFRPRNLTMQVHRALKHAVNAGLLRHTSGRYKAILALNPTPSNDPLKENSDQKSVEGTSKLDAQQTVEGLNSDDKQNRRKREKERHKGKLQRDHSSQRRRERSKSGRRQNPLKHVRKIQKLKYKEADEKDRLPRYNSLDRRVKEDSGNASRSSSTRKSSKARQRDRTNYADPSDSSDCKDKKARVKRKAPAGHECKYDSSRKFSRRSVSRSRSPQRKQSQHQSKYSHNDDDKSNKTNHDNRKIFDGNSITDQDVEKHEESENSSTL